jgi:heme o synthase
MPGAAPRVGRLADYIALTKPRLNALVVATTAAGWCMGRQDNSSAASIAAAVVGTTLVAGGAAALNQVLERDTDALMHRTQSRPLPAGRVSPSAATQFGIALTSLGLLLPARANVASAALALATIVIYLFVYTPLKRRTPAATLLGAVPGALPPLIGWTAAHGSVSMEGVALSAIVFLWQIPHFMAIAWLCRDDYRNAGFPMLPVVEPDGRRAGRNAFRYAAVLLPVTLVPFVAGMAGPVYAEVALALGVWFLGLAGRFANFRSDAAARSLFLGSLAYLPLLWIVLIADRF